MLSPNCILVSVINILNILLKGITLISFKVQPAVMENKDKAEQTTLSCRNIENSTWVVVNIEKLYIQVYGVGGGRSTVEFM